MEYNGKHYYKIDIMGRNGYSFMVVSNEELDELDVLNKAYRIGCFNDVTDLKYAVVDDLVSEYDIENFKSCTHNID